MHVAVEGCPTWWLPMSFISPVHVQLPSRLAAWWSWSPQSTDTGRRVSYQPSSCCLAPFPRGRTENGASSGLVVGEPPACKGLGARAMKADGLLTTLCFPEGLQQHRSSRNKVSGAVLPVALPPVITSGLFTLESCTTSILYNHS